MGPLSYKRYHIETKPAPDIYSHPSRFRVRVQKHRLIGLLLKELVQYRGNMPVVLSRPCVYGVFSGPLGGLAPREDLCVGCLRCTTQYPDIVQIHPNPDRAGVPGLSLSADQVDTILYEARTGRVPVRGAGYRGTFGGQGWDGMWTDMSEIVRPTRDGIHGREYISTSVDIGARPTYLDFRGGGGWTPPREIPIPLILDAANPGTPPSGVLDAITRAAKALETYAVIPAKSWAGVSPEVHGNVLVRLADGQATGFEKAGGVESTYRRGGTDLIALRHALPQSILSLRVPLAAYDRDAVDMALEAGVDPIPFSCGLEGGGTIGGVNRCIPS